MEFEIQEAKQQVIEAGLRLLKENLISRTWGNISARISDTQFVITPSGRDYESLTCDDIVVVNIKKCDYEGDIKPSSECGIHADVYAARPDVNFVIHTHQVYASAVSILGQSVELADEEKDFLGDTIPCAAYGMSSSPELRRKFKKCLKLNKECRAMLLKNHGVLCLGQDMENSFEISSMVEQVCRYKYDLLTAAFSDIKVDNDDIEFKNWDEVLVSEEDLKADGYVDYGSSTCDVDTVTLILKEKEYKYKLGDDKPLGKGLFKKSLNQIAKLHAQIYSDRSITCIGQSTLPNTVEISRLGKNIDPYIDDQAQIIGAKLKCVGKIKKKLHFESAKDIVKGMKDSNAVLIAGQGALICASSQDDLEAAAFVLEKGCIAAKLANCQGDAEAVPARIAKKEREFYIEKYSKLK